MELPTGGALSLGDGFASSMLKYVLFDDLGYEKTKSILVLHWRHYEEACDE